MKKYLKATGFILIYAGIYFALQFLYLIAASIIATIMEVVKNPNMNPLELTEELTSIIMGQVHMAIIFATVISIPIYYAIGIARKQNLFKLCSFSSIKPMSIFMLIIAGISINLSSGYLLEITQRLDFLKGYFEEHDELMKALVGGSNILVVFIGTAIAAPVIEEILFRGLIFNELKKVMSVTAAVVLQGVLFGIYHMQVVQGAYAAIFGILMGLAYVWTKSIWSSIIIHIMINGTSVILSSIPEKAGFITILENYSPMIFVISLLLVIGSYFYLHKSRIQLLES
ncbi:MAG: CPBP family intramembrane metalloprotease [Clostridiaceae bacterium]|jgi:membrane protease YdiL (CAAX protease family)|nr:CPBP family intramembrane metalloprotease [Clostridiaceae bacterium]